MARFLFQEQIQPSLETYRRVGVSAGRRIGGSAFYNRPRTRPQLANEALAAHHTHLGLWTKRACQHPEGVELLKPLAALRCTFCSNALLVSIRVLRVCALSMRRRTPIRRHADPFLLRQGDIAHRYFVAVGSTAELRINKSGCRARRTSDAEDFRFPMFRDH
jgi:hypothetical protein